MTTCVHVHVLLQTTTTKSLPFITHSLPLCPLFTTQQPTSLLAVSLATQKAYVLSQINVHVNLFCCSCIWQKDYSGYTVYVCVHNHTPVHSSICLWL